MTTQDFLLIAGGLAVLILSLLGIIWGRVEAMNHKLDTALVDMDKRIDILDRVGSSITDKPFDSKLIAKGVGEIPNTHAVSKLIERGV